MPFMMRRRLSPLHQFSRSFSKSQLRCPTLFLWKDSTNISGPSSTTWYADEIGQSASVTKPALNTRRHTKKNKKSISLLLCVLLAINLLSVAPQHHKYFECNYGGSLLPLDALFGTYRSKD
jgi:hypothetical protein